MSQPTVVITGGSRGLGRATAEQCPWLGANVVICSENRDDLNAGLAAIGPRTQLAGTVGDVSNPNDVRELMAFAQEQCGQGSGPPGITWAPWQSRNRPDAPRPFVPMILMRLLTGKRAPVDVSTIEPVTIDPETE